mmetsp:Transcript_22353/g.54143  ORF Transcript_22353/g.54143 Transcript_22353/m.54143 type:complete len:87 (+) Transcript_22353:1199-1459(+)
MIGIGIGDTAAREMAGEGEDMMTADMIRQKEMLAELGAIPMTGREGVKAADRATIMTPLIENTGMNVAEAAIAATISMMLAAKRKS